MPATSGTHVARLAAARIHRAHLRHAEIWIETVPVISPETATTRLLDLAGDIRDPKERLVDQLMSKGKARLRDYLRTGVTPGTFGAVAAV